MPSNEKDILLVEDYEFHVELIRRYLEASGYHVSVARTLKEARAYLASRNPSLAIIDLLLPEGSALELLPGDLQEAPFPAIVMTSYGDETTAVEAMRAGAFDYVAKSEHSFGEIAHLVERTLREWQVRVERKKAEAALRRSTQRFKTLVESTTDYVCIKDRSLTFQEVNPALAKAFGRTPEEMIGLTSYDIHDSKDARQIEKWDRRVLKGELIEGRQTRTVDGEKRTFLDVRFPMMNEKEEVEEIFVVSRDITGLTEDDGVERPSSLHTSSPLMQRAMELARAAARSTGAVLLQGESGTGKDYLARWIHDNSTRSSGPYFAINCPALTQSLAESELFGHEKGAFTGAVGEKKGLVELAEGGTLLLNEIGELPLTLQGKLLAFLDTQKFMRVGAQKARQADVRILAATHRRLAEEMEQGRFMRPLYYRLAVLEIHVPPLRERLEDLPALVDALLKALCLKLGVKRMPSVDQGFLEDVKGYHWPGNVRELQNVLERMLILSSGNALTRELLQKADKANTPSKNVRRLSIKLDSTLPDATGLLVRSLCEEALKRSKGNKKETAKILGISRDALYRYIKKYRIEVDGD